MDQRRKSLLLLAVGLVLVLAPVVLVPSDVPTVEETTYKAERAETLDTLAPGVPSNAVLDCEGTISYRECVQAREIGYDGTMRVSNVSVELTDDGRLFFGWDYVSFKPGLARPNASMDNGSLVLSFDPVTQQQVMDDYATDYKALPSFGRRVIHEGSASTSQTYQSLDQREPILEEYQRFVDEKGTYYYLTIQRQTHHRQFPPWIVSPTLRGVVLLAGVGVLYRLVDGSSQ